MNARHGMPVVCVKLSAKRDVHVNEKEEEEESVADAVERHRWQIDVKPGPSSSRPLSIRRRTWRCMMASASSVEEVDVCFAISGPI
jgi:hypothetical protein